MKRIFIVALAFLTLTGITLKAEAVDLIVLNAEGQVVTAGVASAVANLPGSGITPGTAQTIQMSAVLPSTLAVALSAMDIDWTINQDGVYQTRAINITCSNAGTSTVTMNVAGSANLARSGEGTPANLATKYALASSAVFTGLNPPANGTYRNAGSAFDGAYNLNTISGDLAVSIWNKITVPNEATPGTFGDDFTVTFSQSL